MAEVFKVDVTTKLHRLMSHIDNHLIHLRWIRRVSSDENEMLHEKFKYLYNTNNKHIESIDPQLLKTWVDKTFHVCDVPDSDSCSDSISDSTPSSATASMSGESVSHQAISTVHNNSASCSPQAFVHHIRQLSSNSIKTWRQLKRLRFGRHVPHYNMLLYTSVFASDNIYGKSDTHDAITFRRDSVTMVGIVKAIFAHYLSTIPSNYRLVFIRLLDQVDPDAENASVANQFGNIRYKYAISSSGFINTVLFNASCLIEPVSFDVEPYWLKQTRGLQKSFDQINQDCQQNSSIRFFLIIRFNKYHRTQRIGSPA